MLTSGNMSQEFQPGDFLLFQLEAGFGLMRLIAIDESDDEPVWHVSAFEELFLEIDDAERAIATPEKLTLAVPYAVLTNRAFESTQVSRLGNEPVTEAENAEYTAWNANRESRPSDTPIRLLMGLR
jgi:hypothetical protein